MNRKRIWLSAGGAAMAVALITTFLVLSAGPATSKQFATLHVLAGGVDVRSAGQAEFLDARDGATLKEGDTVRTEDDGRAEIEYFDGSVTRLDYDTTFTLEELASLPDRPGSKIIRGTQDSGRTFNRITKLTGSESRVEVGTPTAVAAVRGTAFFIQLIQADDGTFSYLFGVLEGAVAITPEGGGDPVLIEEGHYAVVDSEGNIGPVLELTEEMLAQEWLLFNQCDLDGIPLLACEVQEEETEETEEPEETEEIEEIVESGGGDPTPPPPGPLGPTGDDDEPLDGQGGGPQGPPQPPPPDTTPPNTTITNAPPALDNSSSGSFEFTSTEAGSTFECAFDGGAFTSCTSPRHYTLTDGGHTFRVRARDGAGNVDPTPAVHHWTIDTTPPQTEITQGPDPLTNATDATFAFQANEAVQGFQCDLDGGGFEACGSPKTYQGLGDGQHTFSVRATDLAGNQESTAVHTWTVDTVPPDTVITGGPSGPFNSTSATFTFVSTKAPSSFQCSLDGGAFQPCSSGVQFAGLSEDHHQFAVRAIDGAGNVDPSPAQRSWTVDVTPPQTEITSGPSALTNETDATFAFQANEAVQGFQCDLDGAGFEACDSGVRYEELADGIHTFSVRATDLAGNQESTAVYTWTVDTVAPGVTIDNGPQGTVGVTEAEFTFSSEPGATFECDLDGTGFKACSSPAEYAGLGDGNHTFSVRATDLAGNTGAPATRAWTVDTTAPAVEITSGPPVLTNEADATFEFTAEPGATTECDLDGAGFAPCATGVTYTELADGDHTLTVRATDAAGNSATDSHHWTVDTVGPETTITSGPLDPTTETSATFEFSSEEGATFECDLDGGGFEACGSPKTYQGLGPGGHTFTVRAFDGLGNAGPDASYAWAIEASPPENTPPVATAPGHLNVSQGGSQDFTVTGTDADGDDLTLSFPSETGRGTVQAIGEWARVGTTDTWQATIRYTANPCEPGSAPQDQVDFTVEDGNGGSDTATVRVTINCGGGGGGGSAQSTERTSDGSDGPVTQRASESTGGSGTDRSGETPPAREEPTPPADEPAVERTPGPEESTRPSEEPAVRTDADASPGE